MAARFHPRLVNGPHGDPGLYIALAHEKRALLFDLGDLSGLAPRDLLKVSHCFVSHTHMDHFAGFDHLLRLCLGRDKQLHLYGPRGFLHNLEGKLQAYNWNLVDRYRYPLELTASEIHDRFMRTRRYACRDKFRPSAGGDLRRAFDGLLLDEASLTIRARILDHGIPCLGFRLTEPVHIHIDKTALDRLSLAPGPWLGQLKQALYADTDPDAVIVAPLLERPGTQRRFRIGDLADRITRSAPGQSIGYITDAAGHARNLAAMIDLVRGVDHLFIESAFRSRDRYLATAKYHLTAAQAGYVAALAEVKRYTLFHFSPRYGEDGDAVRADADRAYRRESRPSAPQGPLHKF